MKPTQSLLLAVIADKVAAAVAGPVMEEVPEVGRRLPVGESPDAGAAIQRET